jgi:PAS domain S-box-containing protein
MKIKKGDFVMKNFKNSITLYLLVFAVPFLTQSCSINPIKEINYSNLSIESSQKLLKEIKELGPSLLMNVDSYNILLNELEKYKDKGIVINSLDGITIEANRNYLKMLGYTSEEIKSITYQELTPSKWHAMENDLFRKVMETGYSGVYEKEYIRKDGTVFPIRIQSWLIMDENHKASRLFGIVQDMSSHKKQEGKMKQKLVLVPGIAGNEYLWKFQIKHLSDIADIVVPDISNCNSREEWVEAILNCTEDKFALAGVSMGGWACFKVAAEHPERVTKLALIGTWARHLPEVKKEQYKILERIKNGHFDEFKQEYLDYVSTNLDSSKDEFIKRKLSVNPVSTGSINNFI